MIKFIYNYYLGEAVMFNTPGIGDPYFYEWYVGLEYVIKMINPDNNIDYVTFQSEKYETIDDVIVGYKNNSCKMCYQIKHQIGEEANKSITFNDILTVKRATSLINSLAKGWDEATKISTNLVVPILYTNKKLGVKSTNRTFQGIQYIAYPLHEFLEKVKILSGKSLEQGKTTLDIDDKNLEMQWKEFCQGIKLSEDKIIKFVNVFETKNVQESLEQKHLFLNSLIMDTLDCNNTLADIILNKLIAKLAIWTTTERNTDKVTIEDVYTALGFQETIDINQHRLFPPEPFFNSRKAFCEETRNKMLACKKPYIFFSGNPGSGKTSVLSFLQRNYSLFDLRFHTFKPISPEQHFYNYDEGMCSPENLWGTLLIELRNNFIGKLHENKIPLINDICSLEEMRNHVIRLLDVLHKEKSKDIFVCIDGIDHAARTSNITSFLGTLPKPDEVPNGVHFVLGGQPVSLYKEFYPNWIEEDTVVEKIDMPNLNKDDVEDLIKQHCKVTDNLSRIASMIFEKTSGNNLSVVYAVESIKSITESSEVVHKIISQNISYDITEYYDYIWKYAKDTVVSKINNIPYVDVIIASSILLLNGRLEPRILSNALDSNPSETDLIQTFDNLYPLLQKDEVTSEYYIFHNDFRVYLMKNVAKNNAKYKETAYRLAMYLNNHDEGIVSLKNKIQLLKISDKLEFLYLFYTPNYIIDCLAHGISKKRLEEYSILSYNQACEEKNIDHLINVYNCLKTLRQHESYYENMDMRYISFDSYDISDVDIFEINKSELNPETINDFVRVLDLCQIFLLNNNQSGNDRGNNLYHFWFDSLSPLDFIKIFKLLEDNDKDDANDNCELASFLKKWADILVKIKTDLPTYSVCGDDFDKRYLLLFGDEYFNKCLETENYNKALVALEKNIISLDALEDNLEKIFYSGESERFIKGIKYISNKNKSKKFYFANAICMAYLKDFECDYNEIQITGNNVYDEIIFQWVIMCFLNGSHDTEISDEQICKKICNIVFQTEFKDEEKRTLERLLSFSEMLGKYYASETAISPLFYNYLSWVLTSECYRFIDHIHAYRFLHFVIYIWDRLDEIITQGTVLNDIKFSVINRSYCTLHIKVKMLEYFYNNGYPDIVLQFYYQIYGENAEKILSNDDPYSVHSELQDFGKIAVPLLMEQADRKLKQNVIRYSSYKEDCTFYLFDLFEEISSLEPEVWRTQGLDVLALSNSISKFSNYYDYEIKKLISESAVFCGLNDYYQLLQIEDDFKFSMDFINNFISYKINQCDTKVELCQIWLLICGLNSYMYHSDILHVKSMFNAIVSKAIDIKIDIEENLCSLTPEWISIIRNCDDNNYNENYTTSNLIYEKQNYYEKYKDIDNKEIINELTCIQPIEYHVFDKVTDMSRLLLERKCCLNESQRESISSNIANVLVNNNWYGQNVEELIDVEIKLCGQDCFWQIAKESSNLITEYSYQTISRNLYYLIKEYKDNNLDYFKKLLINEMDLHRLWLEKQDIEIENIDLKYSDNLNCDLLNLIYCILINQLDTKNCRKIEASVYAVYHTNKEYGGLANHLEENWLDFSIIQKEMLLLIIARIVRENNSFSDFFDILMMDYKETSYLQYKFLLYKVLNLIAPEKSEEIKNNMYLADYSIDMDDVPEGYIPRIEDNYLSMLEKYGIDVSKYLYNLEKYYNTHTQKNEKYSDRCDLFLSGFSEYYELLLYNIDKSNQVQQIPLEYRINSKIMVDDPFLITDLPVVKYELKEDFLNLYNKKYISQSLTNIINYDIDVSSQTVIGASVIIPNLSKKSTEIFYYSEFSKSNIGVELSYENINVGLSAGLKYYKELDLSADDMVIELMCINKGTILLPIYGSRLIPSQSWMDIFDCKPKKNNPYILEDENGKAILWLERLFCPCIDNTYRSYCKQPFLFRWICDTEWINAQEAKYNLKLIDNIEVYECEI